MAFIELNDVEEREIVPGYKARMVHSDTMTAAFWNVAAGASLPAHSHHHEQICYVIEGEFELTVDGESRIFKGGTTATIPPNAEHSGRAITDCRIIDIFHPVRKDYL